MDVKFWPTPKNQSTLKFKIEGAKVIGFLETTSQFPGFWGWQSWLGVVFHIWWDDWSLEILGFCDWVSRNHVAIQSWFWSPKFDWFWETLGKFLRLYFIYVFVVVHSGTSIPISWPLWKLVKNSNGNVSASYWRQLGSKKRNIISNLSHYMFVLLLI